MHLKIWGDRSRSDVVDQLQSHPIPRPQQLQSQLLSNHLQTIIGNKVQMMKPHLRHEVRTVQHHQCGEASPPFKFQVGVNSRSFSSFAFARRTVTDPDNRISETGIPKLYEFSSSYD
nr:hypothetical protein Itr_chr02CG12070 [Ipomoea trifida]